mgnify:CR=1 FL=1
MKMKVKAVKKRTQRDYTLGFKLAVVSEVEKGDMTYKQAQKVYGIQGRSTVLSWLRKHGNLNWSLPVNHTKTTPKKSETPSQTIKRLERELSDEKLRTFLLNEVINTSDREFGTSIRKKFAPELSGSYKKKIK